MNIEQANQALNVITQAARLAPLTWSDHVAVAKAVELLSKEINPQPEPTNENVVRLQP